MAIITEEPDSPKPKLRKPKPKPDSSPNPISPPVHPPPTFSSTKSAAAAATAPFHFWFYFTLFVSALTLFCTVLSSLSPQDPKTWFLNLPPGLRHYYSSGRTIKVQTTPNLPQIEVFSIQEGPTNSNSHVLIVHGLGCSSFAFHDVVKFLGRKNVHAVAIDLPGSGFSDKSITVVEESVGGLWEVYADIKEKGLFWGFDQLVEQGYVDFEQNKVPTPKKKEKVKAIELGGEEMGRVLGQVVDSLELAPVDLVLHDSALGLSANWISENFGLIRSVVVLDGVPRGTAFPLWLLKMPIVREVVLGFKFVFDSVLAKCCMKSVGGLGTEAHRILLKGRDGGRAVAGMGEKLNTSFDVSEWSSLDGVNSLPFRLIWSSQWSEKWTEEGSRIASAIPQATLVTHSGGRWTQELNAEEVSESIYEFLSSLPKSTEVMEKPEVEQVHGYELKSSYNDLHHDDDDGHGGHHHHDDHGHAHTGYMDAYGLGHGWAM